MLHENSPKMQICCVLLRPCPLFYHHNIICPVALQNVYIYWSVWIYLRLEYHADCCHGVNEEQRGERFLVSNKVFASTWVISPSLIPSSPLSGSPAWLGVIVSPGIQINGSAVSLLRDPQTCVCVGVCVCAKREREKSIGWGSFFTSGEQMNYLNYRILI